MTSSPSVGGENMAHIFSLRKGENSSTPGENYDERHPGLMDKPVLTFRM